MKQFLKKPLGLAVAATMAIGGMAAYTNAVASTDANALGDLAIVPYYTVNDNFVTGVHVINSSESTQVVKIRLRRGSDSADALDFNIIMSPNDEWVGTVNDDGGSLGITSTDTTCTAPAANGTDALGRPRFVAPDIFAADGAASEGYIEVIGMAQAAQGNPIYANSLHVNGVPVNCELVSSNFLAANVNTNAQTTNSEGGVNSFTGTQNVLKVSYFIRDAASGIEMGDNATHIVDFVDDDALTGAMMTNQQAGINSGDVSGFDFPDLNGGGANAPLTIGRYDLAIRASLGSSSILNDWSFNPANGVATDWVITIPGQYTMDDPADNGSVIIDGSADLTADHRDLPVVASISVFDREEGTPAEADTGGLVISPSPPVDAPAQTIFNREVNVIEWGGNSVLNSTGDAIQIDPGLDNSTGWARLSLESQNETAVNGIADTRQIYDQTDRSGATFAQPTNGIPVIGFTAWQRTFNDASLNYGRIIGHSRVNPVTP